MLSSSSSFFIKALVCNSEIIFGGEGIFAWDWIGLGWVGSDWMGKFVWDCSFLLSEGAERDSSVNRLTATTCVLLL